MFAVRKPRSLWYFSYSSSDKTKTSTKGSEAEEEESWEETLKKVGSEGMGPRRRMPDTQTSWRNENMIWEAKKGEFK